MLEFLINMDIQISLFLNKFGSPYLDSIMLFLSHSKIPIFMVTFFCMIYLYRKFKAKGMLILFILALTTGISDSISYRVFKDNFDRIRPCHNKEIKMRNIDKGCGGMSSFISSHAANSFAAFTLIWLVFKRFSTWFILGFPYAMMVAISRVYLARHYFLDIFCGALLGIIIAFLGWKVIKKFNLLES